jgi:hypothetical protein
LLPTLVSSQSSLISIRPRNSAVISGCRFFRPAQNNGSGFSEKRGLIHEGKLVISGLLLALAAAGAFWFFPRGTKLSESDTILLADFTNTTGDTSFDSSLRDMLRDVEELSTSETAAALDLTEQNVKVRLHRGRAMLRGWLFARVGTNARNAFPFMGVRCDRVVYGVFARLTSRSTDPPQLQ